MLTVTETKRLNEVLHQYKEIKPQGADREHTDRLENELFRLISSQVRRNVALRYRYRAESLDDICQLALMAILRRLRNPAIRNRIRYLDATLAYFRFQVLEAGKTFSRQERKWRRVLAPRRTEAGRQAA